MLNLRKIRFFFCTVWLSVYMKSVVEQELLHELAIWQQSIHSTNFESVENVRSRIRISSHPCWQCCCITSWAQYCAVWLTGFVVGGSNGEFTYLTVDERVEMVRRVRELAASDKLVVAGAGCECLYYNVSLCHSVTVSVLHCVTLWQCLYYYVSLESIASVCITMCHSVTLWQCLYYNVSLCVSVCIQCVILWQCLYKCKKNSVL